MSRKHRTSSDAFEIAEGEDHTGHLTLSDAGDPFNFLSWKGQQSARSPQKHPADSSPVFLPVRRRPMAIGGADDANIMVGTEFAGDNGWLAELLATWSCKLL